MPAKVMRSRLAYGIGFLAIAVGVIIILYLPRVNPGGHPDIPHISGLKIVSSMPSEMSQLPVPGPHTVSITFDKDILASGVDRFYELIGPNEDFGVTPCRYPVHHVKANISSDRLTVSADIGDLLPGSYSFSYNTIIKKSDGKLYTDTFDLDFSVGHRFRQIQSSMDCDR